MSTELPTKPGPYYWREHDDDEWEVRVVELLCGRLGCVFSGFGVQTDWLFLDEDQPGQWLPTPTAEELVELQSKAKMVDDGQDAWGVFNQETHEMVVSWSGKEETQEMSDDMNKMSSKYHYTCEPVTIIRKAKR